MVLVVFPASIPDIPRIYEIYFDAFDNDEMGRLMTEILFPSGINEEFKKAHAAATLAYWHTSSTQFTFKCIDTETDEIVGMGLADLVVKPEEKRSNPGVEWLEGEQRARAERILSPLWEAREELIAHQPHIYVHVIAVDPKHQGRKAGALLCQYGLDYAERLQMPLYFESSPTTLGLYQKVGFELLERNIIHKASDLGTPTDVVVPLMIRMPAVANGMTYEQWQAKGFPKFEAKKSAAAVVDTAELKGDKLNELVAELAKACGGEKNLIAMVAAASSIGLDKLPGLLTMMGISTSGETQTETDVKPTQSIVETTVEVVQP